MRYTSLQLALLAPFGRLGGRLVHVPAAEGAHTSVWQLAAGLGAALIHAVAGWCAVAAPLGVALWLALGSKDYFARATTSVRSSD